MKFTSNPKPTSKNPFPFNAVDDDPPEWKTCLFHTSDLTPAARVEPQESSWAMQYVIAFKIRRLAEEGLTQKEIRAQVIQWAKDYAKHLSGKVYVKTIKHAVNLTLKLQAEGANTRPDEAIYCQEGQYFKLRFYRPQKGG